MDIFNRNESSLKKKASLKFSRDKNMKATQDKRTCLTFFFFMAPEEEDTYDSQIDHSQVTARL